MRSEMLSELNPKPTYRRGRDDIANDFYIPCMTRASTYRRAVGFFHSTVYILAWSALKDFVGRGGRIRIVCSQVLSPEDIEAMRKGYELRLGEEDQKLRDDIQNMLKDPVLEKPTRVLATLIGLGIIEVKIAILERDSPALRRIYHDKVGIFEDHSANRVAFKGSMNETWAALANDGNFESVDVFVNWKDLREKERVDDEIGYFESLWDNTYPGVLVRRFPEIAEKDLVNAADTRNWPSMVDEICESIEAASVISADRRPGGRIPRPHQIDAIRAWQANGRRGILEHATGSGKTFTALCIIRDSLCKGETCLITVPSDILLNQWVNEVKTTFSDIDPGILLCGSGNDDWQKQDLLRPWSKKCDTPRVIISTVQTAMTDRFLGAIRGGPHLLHVADEVHHLGSTEFRRILTIDSGPRLGLSATPRRAGDPEGTKLILTHFGGILQPPFTLADAIAAGTLTPYFYYVHRVSLSDSEQRRWNELTDKVRRLAAINESGSKQQETEAHLKNLLIKRAKIAKNAKGKVNLCTQVLKEYYEPGQKWIVYCDSIVQLNNVMAALVKEEFIPAEYHSYMTGDKVQTIKRFETNGGILVSIRCLDEGIDIPSVSHALILASSKNPREFIQRRGRVLRKAEGKALAFVHDAIVVPSNLIETPAFAIVEGELARAIEFGKVAENPSSTTDIERIASDFGLDYSKLKDEGIEDEDEL